MNNKYSKTNWKNKKEQEAYPHGKRMSAQKGGLISNYFDQWIEYVRICKHCDFEILPDDWDFQKVKIEVECDHCGYISHFPSGKMNAKKSTPFNFSYGHQLTNENTKKSNYFPTILVILIFVISFLLGQTQDQGKIPKNVGINQTLPTQQMLETQGINVDTIDRLKKDHTPIKRPKNKIIINETSQLSDIKSANIELEAELALEEELELESGSIKIETSQLSDIKTTNIELETEMALEEELELESGSIEIEKQTIEDKIENIEIQLLDLDVQLDMDMDMDVKTIHTETIDIKRQLLYFEQRLDSADSNESKWNKTEQMMLNTKRKLKALEEKLKLEGDWGKVRLKLDPKEQYQKLNLKYQYSF
ncbi:MAG: hypothetical protein NZ824_04605 [Candidatus Thioglobus sp.]|nr:hypothetical protein [Candidatus Thioglobus sp.]